MTKDEIQKVRDALAGCIPFSEPAPKYEALAILDRALAAPEQEPFCYVNVNAQGDVTRTIKREDKWCKTPLYRHPAPQSAQPVAQKLRDELLFEIGNYWECAYWEGDSGISRGDQANKILAKITDLIARLTAPPSREWQELSPLEMQDTLRNCAASTFDKLAPNWYEVRQFARAIESTLRAKNTGEQA